MFDQPVKSLNVNIKLYEGKDDDLIQYVKSITYGFRSNAMKQILRNYVNHMFLLPYMQDSDVSFKSKLHSNKKKAKNSPGAKGGTPEKTGAKKKGDTPRPGKQGAREDPVKPEETSGETGGFDLFGAIEAMI